MEQVNEPNQSVKVTVDDVTEKPTNTTVVAAQDIEQTKTSNDKNDTMATPENQKEASKIVIGLGSQLISASMSFIAIMGGIVTYVLINKEPTTYFYVFCSIAFISFVLSMIFGAFGIDDIKAKAQQDQWVTKDNTNWFAFQTGAIYLGIAMVVFLPFTGIKTQKNEIEKSKIIELINQNTKLNSELIEKKQQDFINQNRILELEKKVDNLTKKVSPPSRTTSSGKD